MHAAAFKSIMHKIQLHLHILYMLRESSIHLQVMCSYTTHCLVALWQSYW